MVMPPEFFTRYPAFKNRHSRGRLCHTSLAVSPGGTGEVGGNRGQITLKLGLTLPTSGGIVSFHSQFRQLRVHLGVELDETDILRASPTAGPFREPAMKVFWRN